jgi:acyl-CoA thioester hydrolase
MVMFDGRFEGKVFILPIRIYYEDTDLSSIVYHANYLRYMERARTEFFRATGVRAAYLDEAEPSAWALRRLEIEYLRPARIDDLIEVRTVARTLTGVRMTADQTITCRGEVLTRGSVEACIITLKGRPRRIPAEIRDKLLPFLSET